MSGDQVLLNHLVAGAGDDVCWVDQERHILNLSNSTEHPRVGDKKLKRIRVDGERVMLDDSEIVVFHWTAASLAEHFRTSFTTFHGPVRDLMRRYYG